MNHYNKLIDNYNNRKGKRYGIPSKLHFGVEPVGAKGVAVTVVVANNGGGTGLRVVDPWLMAMISELENLDAGRAVKSIVVELGFEPDGASLTSFSRRLSFLALNNNWKASLTVPNGPVSLISNSKDLLKPEPGEILRKTWDKRTDNTDQDGAVEKMLQTWLAGSSRTNNGRLAVLGEDFMYGKRGKAKVEREVPTGSFSEKVRRDTYILPKYWIDLVTLNKWGQLALIELKVSDPKLEVMAQALDYALFTRVHYDGLVPILNRKLGVELKKRPDIVCYVVNNRYHPRFDGIARYYQPRKLKGSGFSFKKVVLGMTTELGKKVTVEE
jgi:hypothetical protein